VVLFFGGIEEARIRGDAIAAMNGTPAASRSAIAKELGIGRASVYRALGS
jgi:DNA-binding phage protein